MRVNIQEIIRARNLTRKVKEVGGIQQSTRAFERVMLKSSFKNKVGKSWSEHTVQPFYLQAYQSTCGI